MTVEYQHNYYLRRKAENPDYNRERYRKLKAMHPNYHRDFKRAWRAKQSAALLRKAWTSIHQ